MTNRSLVELPRSIRIFLRLRWIYLLHVIALLRPGAAVPSVHVHTIQPGSLAAWDDAELKLMIDEGRRQADRYISDLEQIRGRAQWLFTIGAPFVVAIGSVLGSVGDNSGWWYVLAIASLLGAGYGVTGAAAILVVRADFNAINSAVLSRYERPILQKLARDYAEMLGVGANTVATRLTVFREAVVWLISGGYGGLITWLIVR